MSSARIGGVFAGALLAGSALAAPVNNSSVSFAGSNLDGIVGDGISNANFVVDNNTADGIEIGLKAHERFVGDLVSSGNRYFATAGLVDPMNGSAVGASWNYTLVADFGSNTVADYAITLEVDFDPAFGATDFVTIDVTAQAALLGASGLSRIGDSQNLSFNYWQALLGAPAFNANTLGEYQINFSVADGMGNTLASVTNFVEVVPIPMPTPVSMGLAGLAGIAAVRRRR